MAWHGLTGEAYSASMRDNAEDKATADYLHDTAYEAGSQVPYIAVEDTRVCPHCAGHGGSDSEYVGGASWQGSFG